MFFSRVEGTEKGVERGRERENEGVESVLRAAHAHVYVASAFISFTRKEAIESATTAG